MTIPVTTRSGKGSALTFSEMDTNLNMLARDANRFQQGNVRMATQPEANALTSDTVAITPLTLTGAVNAARPAAEVTLLFQNNAGTQANVPLSQSRANFDLIHVEGRDTANGFSSIIIPVVSIINGRFYAVPTINVGSAGQGDGLRFNFINNTTIGITANSNWTGIARVYGIRL